MSFLAEIAIAIVAGLLQVTVFLATLAWKPFKFIFSRNYRKTVLQSRFTAPKKFYFDMFAGLLSISTLIIAIAGWFFFFSQSSEPTKSKHYEAKLIQWFQSKRNESKVNAAEQDAAANP